jgi:hypothetical protein
MVSVNAKASAVSLHNKSARRPFSDNDGDEEGGAIGVDDALSRSEADFLAEYSAIEHRFEGIATVMNGDNLEA